VRPYETMMIFDPEVEESQVQEVLDRALEVVRSNGGTPGTVDRWGRRTLAYEMNHKREGYYVVAEFAAEPKVSAELDRFLVLADPVMRHKIIRLPDSVGGAGSARASSSSRTASAPAGGSKSGPGASNSGPGSSKAAGPARTASGPRGSGSRSAARDGARDD
jgi:small subunit ribosomal protein S6